MACGEVDYTDDSLHPAGFTVIETERGMRGQTIRELQRTKHSSEKKGFKMVSGRKLVQIHG